MTDYPHEAVAPFDPSAPHGLGHRAVRAAFDHAAVRKLGMWFATHEDRIVTGVVTGPLGPWLPMPLAVLTTAGARSGQPRQAAVLYFTDGPDVVLVASNLGGRKHPSWYHNLRVNPELTVQRGGVRAGYRAALVQDPDELRRLFALADTVYPGLPVYRRRTAQSARTIAVFRLQFTGYSEDAAATGVPPFDPRASRGPAYRGLQAFMRTPAARTLGIKLVSRVDPSLLRWTGGRIGICLLMPTASLTTIGARSGTERTSAVFYFTDGADVILVASNFGQSRHPAWYFNLRAHPRATLRRGGRRGAYDASIVDDEAEHDRLLTLANGLFAGYGDYKAMTAAVGRHIPIFRLTLSGP